MLPEAGVVRTSTGAAVSGPSRVVKVVVCGVTALPARSVTPLTVRVKDRVSPRGAWGTITTSRSPLVKLIVHAIAVLVVSLTCTVVALTEIGSTGSSNTTRMLALVPTSTAPSGGVTACTIGPVASLSGPVVK